MATSSYDSVYALGATQATIVIGQTNAAYFGVQQYLLGADIKYVSGGTLALIGVHNGFTLAAATLAAAPLYYVPTTGLEIKGPAPFYLAALSATCVAQVLFKYTQGASFT